MIVVLFARVSPSPGSRQDSPWLPEKARACDRHRVPPVVVPVLGEIEVTVGAGVDGGFGAAAIPPPQPGRNSTSSNREQTGEQYLCDIKKTLTCRAGNPASLGLGVRYRRREGHWLPVKCDLS